MPLDFRSPLQNTAKESFIRASSVKNVKSHSLLKLIAEGKIPIDPTTPTSVVEAKNGTGIGLIFGTGRHRVSMIVEDMTMKQWEAARKDIIKAEDSDKTIGISFKR